MVAPVNATGWTELMNGSLLGAAYALYEAPVGGFNGWAVVILFFVYQFMLLVKTRNLTLSWVTGLFFASLFAASSDIKAYSLQIMFVLLVFELAGIMFLLLFRK